MSTVALVLIHGVGSQPRDWSQSFSEALVAELGADSSQVRLQDAYWAPRSTLADLIRPAFEGAPAAVSADLQDETYARAYREFSLMLAADANDPALQGFGLGDVVDFVKDKLSGVADGLVGDVANYVARNGIRTGVQNTLHDALRLVDAASPSNRTIIVSHSQGTIISYDVLREAGASYQGLKTWITMGCPLGKYLRFPLNWGGQQWGMPGQVRWLNLFDRKDLVGKELSGLRDWTAPKPIDKEVENLKNTGHAHSHWDNPEVVKIIADEVRAQLV